MLLACPEQEENFSRHSTKNLAVQIVSSGPCYGIGTFLAVMSASVKKILRTDHLLIFLIPNCLSYRTLCMLGFIGKHPETR